VLGNEEFDPQMLINKREELFEYKDTLVIKMIGPLSSDCRRKMSMFSTEQMHWAALGGAVAICASRA
jgi:hypothetical protein